MWRAGGRGGVAGSCGGVAGGGVVGAAVATRSGWLAGAIGGVLSGELGRAGSLVNGSGEYSRPGCGDGGGGWRWGSSTMSEAARWRGFFAGPRDGGAGARTQPRGHRKPLPRHEAAVRPSPVLHLRAAPIDDDGQDDDENDAGSAVGGRDADFGRLPRLRPDPHRSRHLSDASPVYPTDDPDRLLPHCCFGEGASCRSIPSRCLPSQHRGRQIDAAVRRELVNRHPARLLLLDPRSPLRFRRLRHPANLGRGIGAEQMVSTRGLRAKRRLYPRRGDHSASGAFL